MKTKITFKQTSDTHVDILINGKLVGDIWSRLSDKSLSYSGEDSIQICGFVERSTVWDCGRFLNKDMCLIFAKDKNNRT